MTPSELVAWYAAPGSATIELKDSLNMKGLTLRGSGKTIIGGTLSRVRLVATDATFLDTLFDCAPAAGEAWYSPIGCNADGSKRVTFSRCRFGGGSLEIGIGLRGNDVEDLTVSQSVFTGGYQGPTFCRGKRVTIEDSEFHRLGENGITVAGCEGLSVRRNFIHDITPVNGAHPDGIQTWTHRNTAGLFFPVNDVLIEDNIILQGEGKGMQGIFHRSRPNALPDTPWDATLCRNWVVRSNLVYGWAYTNALYLNEGVDNVTIADNLCLSPTDDGVNTWIFMEGVTNLRLVRNVADMFIGKSIPADWASWGNVETKKLAPMLPDLAKRTLATVAGLRI